jgi:acid phosphatase class B
MKKLICAVSAVAMLSACADQPDAIAPAPVPTYTYANMNCRALAAEHARVVANVNTLTASQKKKADSDAVAMGVGMVLFWPALFALSAGSDQSAQLAQAKGQYDAINTMRAQRGC